MLSLVEILSKYSPDTSVFVIFLFVKIAFPHPVASFSEFEICAGKFGL
jgi:hypothetical protein